jgi:hypothetical protein
MPLFVASHTVIECSSAVQQSLLLLLLPLLHLCYLPSTHASGECTAVAARFSSVASEDTVTDCCSNAGRVHYCF